jgi:uncharacterized membrane protein
MKKYIIVLCLFLPQLGWAKLNWEKIAEGEPNSMRDVIYRASVPHGWLIVYTKKSFHFANENIDFGNITFYPDETHEWNP